MAQRIGILTAGGDAPGLNAAIRGFGKAAIQQHGWELIGFRDGMRGLAENRFIELDAAALSGILTTGGTMLGTSRDKVHRMMVDGEPRDMVPTIVENCEKDGIDTLVCLGGGGTAKNAKRLMDAGLNVIHLPKTIDNDIVHTDSFLRFRHGPGDRHGGRGPAALDGALPPPHHPHRDHGAPSRVAGPGSGDRRRG